MLNRDCPMWIGQAIKYSAVGIFNTALDAALYLLLTQWLGLSGLKILAKGISYCVGILNSYHWNRSWTFESRANVASTLTPFVLASLAALGINTLAMYFGLLLFSRQEYIALAMATGITLIWNFSVTKFLVFRR